MYGIPLANNTQIYIPFWYWCLVALLYIRTLLIYAYIHILGIFQSISFICNLFEKPLMLLTPPRIPSSSLPSHFPSQFSTSSSMIFSLTHEPLCFVLSQPKAYAPHGPILITWALWVFQMQLINLKIQSYIHKWEKTSRVCLFVSVLTHSARLFPSSWDGIYFWHCNWVLYYLLNISLDYLLNREPNATVLRWHDP